VAWAQLHGASGTTELHVLDGGPHFQSYLAHSPTLQGPGGQGIWKWIARDYNGDGRVDLWGIATAGTRSGMTEVHVLDGATDYMVCPQIFSTDLDGLWLLAEWHEVSL
jgi:hypothetical protein